VVLPKPSKCRLIRESFFINAPVVVRYFVPKQEFVVSIVHIPINTVHQSRERMLKMDKLLTPSAFGTSPKSPKTGFRGGGRTPQEKERVAREIESTDRGIENT